MTAAVAAADLVHSHTWYANLAGHLAALLYGIPHVMTVHSLEPLRPWKAEQLGGGYARVVLVRAGRGRVRGRRHRRLRRHAGRRARGVPGRGRPTGCGSSATASTPPSTPPIPAPTCSSATAWTPAGPSVVFVGRVTRQKGLPVLLQAAAGIDPAAQLVICAGQADTPELEAEVSDLARQLRAQRTGVIWLSGMLAKREVIQLLSHATVFACPSLYEPLGIVNLEAMACGTAVVGSRVGGIPEVVAEGKTGLLVPPGDPPALASAINALVTDPPRAADMGRLGRERAVAEFGWASIAAQTAALYAELAGSGG